MSRIGVFEPQHTHKSGEANAHNFFVEIKQVGRQIAAPFVFFVPERARPWPKAVSGDEKDNTLLEQEPLFEDSCRFGCNFSMVGLFRTGFLGV